MRFQDLPSRLQAYIVLHFLVLAPLLWVVWHQPAPADEWLTGILLFATLVAGTWKLELTVFQGRMSGVFAIVCLALLLQGSQAAVLCAAAGALVTTLVRSPEGSWRIRLQRQPLHRFLFNPAHCALVCALASLAYMEVVALARAGTFGIGCGLTVFTGVYFLLNSVGISVAIGLQQQAKPGAVWRENFLWTAPGFFASALAAGVIAVNLRLAGAWALVFLPPLYLIHHACRLYLDRLKQANSALMEEVAERRRVEAALRKEREFLQAVLENAADCAETLASVARLTVPYLADACVVDMLQEGTLVRRLAAAHIDPAGAPLLDTGGQRDLAASPEDCPIRQALRTRASQCRAGEALTGTSLGRAYDGLFPASRLEAITSVPLVARERTLGVITFFTAESSHRGRPVDLSLAEDLARHAALAVDNARLYRELQEDDRRKEVFLGMLGHELRTPLAAVTHSLEAIYLRGTDDLRIQRAVEMMRRQVRHQSQLVDDLLDVSRIRQGKIRLRKEPVALRDILAHAVESTRPLIESRNHVLTVGPCDETLCVTGDRTRLEQVVVNLLTNAARYTDPGGHIWLSVEVGAGGQGPGVGGRRDAVDSSPTPNPHPPSPGEAIIRVRDTGIGISPEMLSRVFDVFTQAGSGAERAHEGLGLGLSLVRQLVELHGGRVEAHSDGEGRGSEFIVRLPIAECGLRIADWNASPSSPKRVPAAPSDLSEQAPGSTPATEPPSPAVEKGFLNPQSAIRIPQLRRVLVVDDNADAAASLAEILDLWGHEACVACSGIAALEAISRQRPDIVLLDIGMPGMDGYEVAREIRRRADGRRLPLVALTGYGQRDDIERALEAGFDAHVTKPAELEELQAVLQSACGERVRLP
jgi:signal transduction histidine kinase/ActR/RegA family two-component response regulator